MKDFVKVNCIFIANVFGIGRKKSYSQIIDLKNAGLIEADLSDNGNIAAYEKLTKTVFSPQQYKKATDIFDYCDRNDIKITAYFDNDYPDILKEIDIPPIVLYSKGKYPNFNETPAISIVGPRKCSEFGSKSALRLGYRFSLSGMLVVSVGALGCDSQVHKGSLVQNGRAVMILPCGIDYNYLKENEQLRSSILKNGCLLSEYPPETPVKKYSFHLRNRLIAGISRATVIVEAGEKSGALITAQKALSYGRTLYVIPGNPSTPEYKGSNKLLLDGAKPLIDIFEVFNYYSTLFPGKIDTKKPFEYKKTAAIKENPQKKKKISKETLSKEANMLYNYLDKHYFTIDDLSVSDLSTNEILSALTELELEGIIESQPGGSYKII